MSMSIRVPVKGGLKKGNKYIGFFFTEKGSKRGLQKIVKNLAVLADSGVQKVG